MNSTEILQMHFDGRWSSDRAVQELDSLASASGSLPALQEAAKARYAAGFLHRTAQFSSGAASAMDMCLNIRDLILFLGRMKLPPRLCQVVRQYGGLLGLECSDDQTVSCSILPPKWLAPDKFITDTYALRRAAASGSGGDESGSISSSPGDEILRQNTVFQDYRSFDQKLAVHTALNLPGGHTLLISLPTGGGKSLVTQMIASSTDTMKIVIVPTVALALDQYHAAERNLQNVNGLYCYRGDQSDEERQRILQSIRDRTCRVLFISPEAVLKNVKLHSLLSDAAQSQYLSDVIIDEAHIVPDWGVLFRPDFQIFSIVLNRWRVSSGNRIRTFLLSATLSDDVVDTLFSLFGTEGRNVQVRCDALRKEPRFYFYTCKSRSEQTDKTAEAVKFLPKPMVVYVLEPQDADDMKKRLVQEGFRNIPVFTGNTKDNDRDVILRGWKDHQYDVVVATSAFGIGVDKPDVRTVIHACCPENLSRFYQEVGRGGRDGFPSISLFMPYQSAHDSWSDVRRASGLVSKQILTEPVAAARWIGMRTSDRSYISSDGCRLDTAATPPTMSDDAAEHAGTRNMTWNINLLMFLHRNRFLELTDFQFNIETKTYEAEARILDPVLYADGERLAEALKGPRAREYEYRLQGYRLVSRLISSPRSQCWGRTFKHLFPLAGDVCSGCPVDPEGRQTGDAVFKLRKKPDLSLPPAEPSLLLRRRMGEYGEAAVTRNSSAPCSQDEVRELCRRAVRLGIGAVAVPSSLASSACINGIVLDYDEFLFAVNQAPYLFAKGVVCVFSGDRQRCTSLYQALKKLRNFGYRVLLYCNEQMMLTISRKPVSEIVEGYCIPLDRL